MNKLTALIMLTAGTILMTLSYQDYTGITGQINQLVSDSLDWEFIIKAGLGIGSYLFGAFALFFKK